MLNSWAFPNSIYCNMPVALISLCLGPFPHISNSLSALDSVWILRTEEEKQKRTFAFFFSFTKSYFWSFFALVERNHISARLEKWDEISQLLCYAENKQTNKNTENTYTVLIHFKPCSLKWKKHWVHAPRCLKTLVLTRMDAGSCTRSQELGISSSLDMASIKHIPVCNIQLPLLISSIQ